ncbi:hypothetical protein BB561_000047 [Smittium simulii]|uniref:Uncharacterized protein n=1 Tax=Smittium simulii TaxID=133385 RepID=A0A2T9Z0S5_9FUNG|nr:hypothetical protein BB561_000047 [Smittium simulii]
MLTNSCLNNNESEQESLPANNLKSDQETNKSTIEIKNKVLQLFAEIIQKQNTSQANILSTQDLYSNGYICSEPDYLTNAATHASIIKAENNSILPNSNSLSSISASVISSTSNDSKPTPVSESMLLDLGNRNSASPAIVSNNLALEITREIPNSPKSNIQNTSKNDFKTKNLERFDEIVKKLKQVSQNNDPSHKLIKSNSLLNDSVIKKHKSQLSLKNKFSRLPRRNLKPLDFSSIRNGFMSDKNDASIADNLMSSPNTFLPSSNAGFESTSLYKSNGSLDCSALNSIHPSTSNSNLSTSFKNVDHKHKPFANIMKRAYDRMVTTKKENKNQLQNYIHEKKRIVESLGFNLNADYQNSGVIIGAPAQNSLPQQSMIDIQNDIEKAVCLTNGQISSCNIYGLWDHNNNSFSYINNQNKNLEPNTSEDNSNQTTLVDSKIYNRSPNQIETCTYCQKTFKSLSKKISHEQRCSLKLEAMLYSQPEVNETNDSKFSPSSQHLTSLLESVPDYSDSENESIETNTKIIKKRKTSVTKKGDLSLNINNPSKNIIPTKSHNIQTTASSTNLLNPNKQSTKLKSSKRKQKIVDPEDTMSLSEGSELSRFHCRGTNDLLFDIQGSSNKINDALSNNATGTKNTQVTDFIGLPFPQIQNLNNDNHISTKNSNSFTINKKLNTELNMLPSDPLLNWTPDSFNFNAGNTKNSSQALLNTRSLNNLNDLNDKQQNYNLDFLSIINSMNPETSQNAEILSNLLTRASNCNEFISSNVPITDSPNLRNNSRLDNNNLGTNVSSSKKVNPNKNKSENNSNLQYNNQKNHANSIKTTSPFVSDGDILSKNYGSSSTITLPQDTEDYQNIDNELNVSESFKPNNLPENLANSDLVNSFMSANSGLHNSINQNHFSNTLTGFENSSNFEKLNLDLSLLQNNSTLLSNTPFMMDLNFEPIQSSSMSASLTAPLSAFPDMGDEKLYKSVKDNGLTPARTKISQNLNIGNINKKNLLSNNLENKEMNPNLINVNHFTDLQNQTDIGGNFGVSSNHNDPQLFNLELLNGSLETQIDMNNFNSLFLSPSQSNLIDWNNVDENIDREFEGMINFD